MTSPGDPGHGAFAKQAIGKKMLLLLPDLLSINTFTWSGTVSAAQGFLSFLPNVVFPCTQNKSLLSTDSTDNQPALPQLTRHPMQCWSCYVLLPVNLCLGKKTENGVSPIHLPEALAQNTSGVLVQKTRSRTLLSTLNPAGKKLNIARGEVT